MLKLKDADMARTILSKCRDLTDAETKLAQLTPIPTKAQRWGLYDSWAGRPMVTSGLVSELLKDTKEGKEIIAQYKEAFEYARQLFLDGVPS